MYRPHSAFGFKGKNVGLNKLSERRYSLVYKVIIKDAGGHVILELETMLRLLARDAVILCQENNVACDVHRVVEPVPVKFKGIGDKDEETFPVEPKPAPVES